MNGEGTVGSTVDGAETLLRTAVRTVIGGLAPERTDTAAAGQQLVLDLGYDSLRLVELAFVIEELFGLDPDAIDDAPAFDRVGDVEAYLWELVRTGQARVPSGDEVTASLQGF